MNLSLLVQYIVISLAVMLSAGYVIKKQWPEQLRSARIFCAIPLLREGRAAWMRGVGRIIAPAPRLAGEGGCAGCNDCGSASS
jgi:hypothetical protein